MKWNITLPPIIVGTQDYYRLIGTVGTARHRGSPNAEALVAEMQRAVIVHPDDLPWGVVSTNSRVTYRLDDHPDVYTRVLVHAGEATCPGVHLSVMTPLGTALLGLGTGDRMPFRTSDGEQHQVLVERVVFTPLACAAPRTLLTARPPQAGDASAATAPLENSRESLDRRLDAALEETFPASDPVSIVVSH
ncbi:MAG TPA: GreA/GreB family elongation factor [Hyphomicrobiaceae bacterium]|nr:GreA/GreB family elongation factor [Hyphomicrobiaceae bacterium]